MDIVSIGQAVRQAMTKGDKRYVTSAVPTTTSIVVDKPSGVMEALRVMWFIGTSYLADNTNAAVNYFDRIIARVSPQAWWNSGVNGALTADMCAYSYGTVTSKRAASARGVSGATTGASTFVPAPFLGMVAIIDPARNDAGLDGTTTSSGTTAKSRAGFKNALFALIALFRCQSKQENGFLTTAGTTSGSPTVTITGTSALTPGMQVIGTGIPANSYVRAIVLNTSFKLSSSPTSDVFVNATVTNVSNPLQFSAGNTYTGTWTMAAVATSCSGASVAVTTVNGASVSIPVVIAGAASQVYVVVLALDNAAAGATGASFTTKVDALATVPGTTSDQMRKSGTGPNNAFCQMAIPVGVLAVGAHTIVLTHTGTTGQQLFFDCVLVESPTPPTCVVLKIPQLPSAGYTATATYLAAGASWVKDQLYNGLIDTVVAQFPADGSVVAFDPNEAGSGWDFTTMIGATDGLSVHKNDKGERWTADWLMGHLNKLPARLGLVKL